MKCLNIELRWALAAMDCSKAKMNERRKKQYGCSLEWACALRLQQCPCDQEINWPSRVPNVSNTYVHKFWIFFYRYFWQFVEKFEEILHLHQSEIFASLRQFHQSIAKTDQCKLVQALSLLSCREDCWYLSTGTVRSRGANQNMKVCAS